MQSKNTTAIVHAMGGMCDMHKLYVRYLEHTWDVRSSIVTATSGVNTEAM